MAAAKQEHNQNMKLSTTLPGDAGVVHKQAVPGAVGQGSRKPPM
jgi:hypothetical protein